MLTRKKHKRARDVFASNLRLMRQRFGFSQEKLAELAGLHRTYIGSVERAERNISIDNMELLAKVLDMSLRDLLANMEPK